MTRDEFVALPKDALVQIAEPREIFTESRFWIPRGEVVAHSVYARGGQPWFSPDVSLEALAFTKARIAEWSPQDAFVIDVADTPHGLRIIELNTFNAAGFYAADVQRLVIAVEDTQCSSASLR